tara:strand:+ start:73 stop:282 length:210 start_codon:yes stop_codon:yes gene_type:complete
MSQQIESQEQALSVLVQAAQLAQKRGAYDLTEAGLISQAVRVFAPEPALEPAPVEVADDSTEDSAEEAE